MKKGDDIEDLMGLIELAEKSTNKLNKLKDHLFSLIILIFITVMIIFIFYFLLRQYLYETLGISYFGFEFIVGFFMSIFVLPLGFKFLKIRKNIASEKKITSKLYDLIDPLRSSLEDEMSIMKMATIEMRLSRIHFEEADKTRNSFKTKPIETSNSKAQKELSLER